MDKYLIIYITLFTLFFFASLLTITLIAIFSPQRDIALYVAYHGKKRKIDYVIGPNMVKFGGNTKALGNNYIVYPFSNEINRWFGNSMYKSIKKME